MVHLFVVENFLTQVVVVKMDVQQNLDALNLDVVLTFQGVVNLVHFLQVVVVDVELRHQLKMDYYLVVVDGVLHYQ
jgi:protein involved in sex pheromone biosynthesis